MFCRCCWKISFKTLKKRRVTNLQNLIIENRNFQHSDFMSSVWSITVLYSSEITRSNITGSAVAQHCCKAHSKSIGKIENSTPCKIVTPENFILKLDIRNYVENITHYTNFHVHRFSGGFSTNRWNITLLWLFFLSCPVLFSRSHAQLEPRDRFSRFMPQMTWFGPRTVLFGVRTMNDIIWGKCAPKTPQKRRE